MRAHPGPEEGHDVSAGDDVDLPAHELPVVAGEVPGAVALVLHHRAPAHVGGVREVEVAVEVRAGHAEPGDLEEKKQLN